jgi:hypothetical protein
MAEKEIIEFFNKMIDSIDLEQNLLDMVEYRKEYGFSKEELRDYELYGDCFIPLKEK